MAAFMNGPRLVEPAQKTPYPQPDQPNLFNKTWWLFWNAVARAVNQWLNFGQEIEITGDIDGINSIFFAETRFHLLFRNGLCQRLTTDYTLNGLEIRFNAYSIPQNGDQLWAV